MDPQRQKSAAHVHEFDPRGSGSTRGQSVHVPARGMLIGGERAELIPVLLLISLSSLQAEFRGSGLNDAGWGHLVAVKCTEGDI